MSGFNSLLKASNYKLLLNSGIKNLEFFCTEINLPAITIGSTEIPYQSMTRKMPGDSLTYDNLSATVLIDEELKTFDDLFSTLNFTHNPETNRYKIDPILWDAHLYITTNKNNVQYHFWFRNAWIETFSELQFLSTTTDENPITTTIGIKFDYYTMERVQNF